MNINDIYNENKKWLLENCDNENYDNVIKIINFHKKELLLDNQFNHQLRRIHISKRNTKISTIISEYIFELWTESKNHNYDSNINWLLEHCDGHLLEKIINSQKSNWLNDEQFIDHLKKTHSRFNNYKVKSNLDIVCDFIFQLWSKDGNEKFDNNLKWLLLRDNEIEIERNIEYILSYNYSWIYDVTFTTNYFSLKPESIICNFIVSKNATHTFGNLEYNTEIKWVINNGNESSLESLLKYKSLFSSKEFINEIKLNKDKYDDKIYCQFLFEIWILNGKFEYTEDIDWIFHRCSASTLYKLLFEYYNYLHKDKQIVSMALNVKSIDWIHFYQEEYIKDYKEEKESLIPITKFKIVKDFIYEIWSSENTYTINDNLIWLIQNSDEDTVKSIIESNKMKWLDNYDFVSLIRKKDFEFDDTNLKENFIYESCLACLSSLSSSAFNKNENLWWLLMNGSINIVKMILSKLLNYDLDIIDKIYIAIYPNNDINFFKKNAQNSEWSYYIKEHYIHEQELIIKKKFTNLFIIEQSTLIKSIEKRENQIKTTHSATDLASFTFCPASYLINQLYHNNNFTEQESVFIGIKEHEKQRLISLLDYDKVERFRRIIITDPILQNFHSRINNSKCISKGHSSLNHTIYYSNTGKLSGIPDYIFQEKHGYFAVEEKYTIKKYEDLIDIYENHKIQALAYLYGLSNFHFSEVYVIYWFITKKTNDSDYYVYNYKLFTITKTLENKNKIVDCFNKVDAIQRREPFNFTKNNINYRKCVKCNYFPFCEFKKGKKSILQLPSI